MTAVAAGTSADPVALTAPCPVLIPPHDGHVVRAMLQAELRAPPLQQTTSGAFPVPLFPLFQASDFNQCLFKLVGHSRVNLFEG